MDKTIFESIDLLFNGFDVLEDKVDDHAQLAYTQVKDYLERAFERFLRDWVNSRQRREEKLAAEALVLQKRKELEEAEAVYQSFRPKNNIAPIEASQPNAPPVRKAKAGKVKQPNEQTPKEVVLDHFADAISALVQSDNAAPEETEAVAKPATAAEEPTPQAVVVRSDSAGHSKDSDINKTAPAAVIAAEIITLEDDNDNAETPKLHQDNVAAESVTQPDPDIKVILDTAANGSDHSDDDESQNSKSYRSSSGKREHRSSSSSSSSNDSDESSDHDKDAVSTVKHDLYLSGVSSASSKSAPKQAQNNKASHVQRGSPPPKRARKSNEKPAAYLSHRHDHQSSSRYRTSPSPGRKRHDNKKPHHRDSGSSTHKPFGNISARTYYTDKRR